MRSDQEPSPRDPDALTCAYREARRAVADVLVLSTRYPHDDWVVTLTTLLVQRFLHESTTAAEYAQVVLEAEAATQLILSWSGGPPLQA